MTLGVSKIGWFASSQAPTGLDRLGPTHSLLTRYVRSDALSRKTLLLAIPVFATLDIVYHATAISLKALRAVAWMVAIGSTRVFAAVGESRPLNALRAMEPYRTGVSQHLLPIFVSMVGLVVYPVVGMVSTNHVIQLAGRVAPPSKRLKTSHVAVTIACGAIFAMGLALYWYRSNALNRVEIDVERPPNGSPFELEGNLIPAFGTLGCAALARVSWGCAHRAESRGRTTLASLLRSVSIVSALIPCLFGMYTWNAEERAQTMMRANCRDNGPGFYTCDLDSMVGFARRIRSKPEFIEQHAGKGFPIEKLTWAELCDINALRALYGTARDLLPNEQETLRNRLRETLRGQIPKPKSNLGVEIHAASLWHACSTLEGYVRERGSVGAHLKALWANYSSYGHWHGRSYAQVIESARYYHSLIRGVELEILGTRVGDVVRVLR